MINFRLFMTSLFNLLLFTACTNSTDILYLDKNFPGLEPQIYAPGLLSLPDRYEHGLVIRNNGQEHYFGLDGGENWTYNGLVCLKRENGNNLTLDTLNFTNNIVRKNNGIIGGEPFISADNRTMYFVSDYPPDIWKVRINNNGMWGEPIRLDSIINSENSEWYPIIASDKCLYFSRNLNDNVLIYKSKHVNGYFQKATKFEAAFNYNCGDQVFSRNMDYIIFASPRDGGYGNNDLYVAFRKEDGEWTDGINMGQDINTAGTELAPYISPDSEYLFFTRRDKFNGASSSDIYWVSLDIISKIKNSRN